MSSRKPLSNFLPCPLFDSHFHALHLFKRNPETGKLLSEALESNLVGAVEVAVDEHNFENRVSIAEEFPGLTLSAGIHPSSTSGDSGEWDERFSVIRQQCTNLSVVAVGETGLDFFREYAPRILQEQAFRDHLRLASETGLPVIIHNRSADDRVLELLKESDCRTGVFHCFSSGRETAQRALDLGFHISFAGNITYKNTADIHEAARIVPADRILIETDAPYLSPQSVRGRTNHPGHMGYTLETLAEIRGEDIQKLAENTVANAQKLFMPR